MGTADFFQPGTTYKRGRWLFQCLAVAPRPINQEPRAVGFLYRPTEQDTATGLDLADWEHGEWIPATVAPRPVPDVVKKCGPQTVPLYDCGGLAYVHCLKPKGHDGQHTP